MRILGISCFYHDSAAALLVDGRVVAACQEERFTRRKHDPSFPKHAIDACLDLGKLSGDALDLVCFYEKPLRKFDRVLETTAAAAPWGRERFVRSMPGWFVDKLRIEDRLHRALGAEIPVIHTTHHEAHAASAFFVSPFERAATLTMDGVGEWTTTAIGLGHGSKLKLLQTLSFPHSLGLLYSAFTQYLGFRVNNGEYKVMGLAPYGSPRFVDTILEHLIHVAEDGSYTLNTAHFDFLWRDSTIGPSFAPLFGAPARDPEAPLTQHHMDIARSIQVVTERIVLAQARHARQQTDASKLVMAGGVALNSVANGKLIAEGIFDEVWIQPAAGDAGGALGAALIGHHHVLKGDRITGPRPGTDAMQGAYLGTGLHHEDIDSAVQAAGLTAQILEEDALIDATAALLADQKVVGWCQGRMEFGPRALGARSILASPTTPDMQRNVNARIKFREGFRPFAPAVPIEHAKEWFDVLRPSPYMLTVVPVAQAKRHEVDPDVHGLDRLWQTRSQISAVTHVDHSARVQTVDGDTNPRFYRLLHAMGERTGIPVLLNTSFNLRGEPVVCTPADAVATFLASGMHALVLDNRLILRPDDRAPTGVRPPAPEQPTPQRTDSQLRTFGLGGGTILGVLAGLQLWADPDWTFRGWLALPLLAVAVPLFLGGAVAPERLRATETVFARWGKRIGHLNSVVLLSVLHLAVLTPLSLMRRAVGIDPLGRPGPTLPGGHWREAQHDPDDLARYHRLS